MSPPTQPDSTQPDQTRPDVLRPAPDIEESRVFTPCNKQHTTKMSGEWMRGDDETPGLVICANGVQQVKLRCNDCGHVSSPLPYKIVHRWGIRREDVTWTKTNPAHEHAPCVYKDCGLTPTEIHHFAPRNTFGSDCDLWPTAPLCRTHHREWHQRMDGYQWHRKGVAA